MLARFGNRNDNGVKNDANYLQTFNVENEIVLVLSTTWNDLSDTCVNDVNTLRRFI